MSMSKRVRSRGEIVAANDDELARFETGAVRQKQEDVRFDLISPLGLKRLAETCASGARKYSDHNWRKGIPFSNLLGHVLNHLNEYQLGDRSEDHLAHAAWGLFALMEFEETRPELDDLFFHKPEVAQ